jgi:hypothetical protein
LRQLRLDLLHLLLHARRLLDEFSETGHKEVVVCGLRANVNNLTFEDLQSLLNERIVFKITLS